MFLGRIAADTAKRFARSAVQLAEVAEPAEARTAAEGAAAPAAVAVAAPAIAVAAVAVPEGAPGAHIPRTARSAGADYEAVVAAAAAVGAWRSELGSCRQVSLGAAVAAAAAPLRAPAPVAAVAVVALATAAPAHLIVEVPVDIVALAGGRASTGTAAVAAAARRPCSTIGRLGGAAPGCTAAGLAAPETELAARSTGPCSIASVGRGSLGLGQLPVRRCTAVPTVAGA
mgnify:CR=1 FL=1